MKRLWLLAVSVALCSFELFNYWQQTSKQSEFITIVTTPEQAEWLEQQFALENAVNEMQKKVDLLQETYDRVLNEPKHAPHWSAADARKHMRLLEKTTEFAKSKKCTARTEETQHVCRLYDEAQYDKEWWFRLSMIAVQLSAAQHDLIQAKIKTGEYKDQTQAAQQKLMKLMGTA